MYNKIYEILRTRNPSWSRERLADETTRRIHQDAPETPVGHEVVEPPVNIIDAATGVIPDDLTRVKGIGKKIAEKLADIDITEFAQIASLTDQEVVDLDELLSFKGRVVREKWVEQAQAILRE